MISLLLILASASITHEADKVRQAWHAGLSEKSTGWPRLRNQLVSMGQAD